MSKCIVTVLGHDKVGSIGRVCTFLAESEANILDITQSIISGYFYMMLVVDITNLNKDFANMVGDLEKLGKELGVDIRCQKAEIFEKMHTL